MIIVFWHTAKHFDALNMKHKVVYIMSINENEGSRETRNIVFRS